MKPLTPEMVEVLRELRGIVSLSARLRFCATLLAPGSPTPIDTRIAIARGVLLMMAVEVDSAQERVARPRPERLAEMLDEIRAIAKARLHVRRDPFARVYYLAREAGRVLRSGS